MPVMPLATPQRDQDHFSAQTWFGLGLSTDSPEVDSLAQNEEKPDKESADERHALGAMSASGSHATVRSEADSEGTSGSTWNLFGGRDPVVRTRVIRSLRFLSFFRSIFSC